MHERALYNSKKKLIVILVLLFILLLRIPHITNSTAETGDLWRQADTESIARNFIKYRFNIFYPQFNYDGAPPNYVQLELQLTTFIIASLYKVFGYHIWLARLVPLSFYIMSAYFVFLIAGRFYSFQQAVTALTIYGILPITIFFSRAIMPEAAMLCFLTAGYYFFLLWYDGESLPQLILSAVLTCLAISQKIPAAFLGLAMLALCVDKYKLKAFLRWDLWVFALISLLPNIAYFLWAGSASKTRFVSGIALDMVIPKLITAVSTLEAYEFFRVYPRGLLGLPVLILSGIGLLTLYRREEKPILYFALAMLLEVALIVSAIRLRYYLIILAPIMAILAGKVLGQLWNMRIPGKVILAAILLYISYTSVQKIAPEYHEQEWLKTAVEIINTHTKPGDLIVIGTEEPALLSISNRAGWRGNIKYDARVPKDIAGGMDYYIRHGAKYFVVYNGFITKDKGDYIRYLDKSYEKLEFGQGIVMYKLQ